MARIKVGSKVLCRLYNSVERKFYGDAWEATVLAIEGGDKPFQVTRPGYTPISLRRKEIKKIVG